MSLVSLLIVLLVAAVVLWLARLIINAFSLPHPWGTVLFVIVALVVLLWVLNHLGLGVGLRL